MEKETLNAPLILGELGEVALAMSNDKCPGPDGTLVEFNKAHWHSTCGTSGHPMPVQGDNGGELP